MITHSSILVWEIPMDRGAAVCRVTKSQTTERLSTPDADDIEFLRLRDKQNLRWKWQPDAIAASHF